MEKKNYVKPLLNSEAFVPQEYVAACEKYIIANGTNITFNCDLTTWWDENGLNWSGYTIYDSNKKEIGTFRSFCKLDHIIDTSEQNVFKTGYAKKNILGFDDWSEYKEIVYYIDSTGSIHCSKSVGNQSWVQYSHS